MTGYCYFCKAGGKGGKTMRDIAAHIRKRLDAVLSSEEEARSMTRIIMEDLLGLDMRDYYIGKKTMLTQAEQATLEDALQRIAHGEPVQYVTGKAWFMDMMLHVDDSVLIPRPETAGLVETVIKENKGREDLKIIDIGTGSGCIAIALAKSLNAEVHGWDVSDKTLATARANAAAQHASVTFSRADILDKASWQGRWDIIVSNPPYVTESEKADMASNVLEHEPHTALFVPDNEPLLFYRNIAEMGKTTLNRDGKIYFEINERFGSETRRLLESYGYRATETIKDMYDKDRIVKGIL